MLTAGRCGGAFVSAVGIKLDKKAYNHGILYNMILKATGCEDPFGGVLDSACCMPRQLARVHPAWDSNRCDYDRLMLHPNEACSQTFTFR